MKRIVIGNWKCHKTSDAGRRWFDKFAEIYQPHPEVKVVIAPSMVSIENIAVHLAGLNLTNVALAGQDISPFPLGSYTGAVAADMVRKLAGYVIVGHSERRRYFHETNQDVMNKAIEAADAGLTPIVCVDNSNAQSQLGSLAGVECDQLLVAYTPVDDLNFNIPESPAKVAETVNRIRLDFPAFRVIYGGAVSRENVRDYLQLPSLAGVFVGSASLEPESFAEICRLSSLSA
jgi:triosephosphate isomerase (TIM)